MATAKKTTKKVTKKPTSKVTKKPVAKRKTSKATKASEIRTLRVAKADPFFSFKITRQTVYWTILVLVIIVTQLMILNTQLQVAETINSIQVNQ